MADFGNYDKNGKGIDFEQLKSKLDSDEVKKNKDLKKFFGIFDTENRNGVIDTELEKKSLFSKASQYDKNQDGTLDNSEISMMLNSEPDLAQFKDDENVVNAVRNFFGNTDNNQKLEKTVIDGVEIYTQNGKIVKKKNGNEITEYTYNKTEDGQEYVTIKTSTSTTNVLKVEDDGTYLDSDFINSVSKNSDGNEVIVTKDATGRIVETIIQNENEATTTIYNTDSIYMFNAFKEMPQLKLGQIAIKDGKQYFAYYDENGNTITHAKNGDSVSRLTDKFDFQNVEEFYTLNPSAKDKGLLVGQNIVVPNMLDANDERIISQGDVNEELSKYSIDQFRTKHLTNISKETFNALNKIQGFELNNDNVGTYFKFNALDGEVQQKVLDTIKTLSKQGKTPDEIKEYFLQDANAPQEKVAEGVTRRINLFDGFTLNLRAFNGESLKGDMSVKDFVTQELGLDISKGEGKKLYDALCNVSDGYIAKDIEEMFSNIKYRSTVDYKKSYNEQVKAYNAKDEGYRKSILGRGDATALKNNKPITSDEAKEMYKAVITKLTAPDGTVVNTKYDDFINNHKDAYLREFTADMVATLHGQGAEILTSTGAQKDILQLGKYVLAPIGKFYDKKGAQIYDKMQQDCYLGNDKLSSTLEAYSMGIKTAGTKYDKAKVKKCYDVFQNPKSTEAQKKKAMEEAFGHTLVNTATDLVDTTNFIDGATDMALLLYGTGAISKVLTKGIAWASKGAKVTTTAARAIKGGKNAATLGERLLQVGTSATTFALWDSFRYTLGYYTNDIDETQLDENSYTYGEGLGKTALHSATFGAFAGAWGQLATSNLVKLVCKNPESTKIAQKAMSEVSSKLGKTSSFTSTQLLSTYQAAQQKAMQTVGKEALGFASETVGFSLYEIGSGVLSGNIKIESAEDIGNVLWGQTKNLLSFKAMGKILFMHKNGKIPESMMKLGKERELHIENKNGVFEVKYPDGKVVTAKSMQEVVGLSNAHYENMTLYEPLKKVLAQDGKVDLGDGVVIKKGENGYLIELPEGRKVENKDLKLAMQEAQGEYQLYSFDTQLKKDGKVELPNKQVITLENNTYKTKTESGKELEASSLKDLLQLQQRTVLAENAEKALEKQGTAILGNMVIQKAEDESYKAMVVSEKGEMTIIEGKSVEEVLGKLEPKSETEVKPQEVEEIKPEPLRPDVKTKQMNFGQMFARLKEGHVNYTLLTTENGRQLIKIENSTKLYTANRFDYYEFDKDGNMVKSQTQISENSAKEMFAGFENAKTRNIQNRGGNLNAGIPVMDIADGLDANATARNIRNEVSNSNVSKLEIRELTDDEFEAKKAELSPKMQQFDELKDIDQSTISQYGCQVLEKIIKNPMVLEFLKKNTDIEDWNEISVANYEEAQKLVTQLDNVIFIINKFENYPKLLENEDVIDKFLDICEIENTKVLQVIIDKMANIQENNPELWDKLAYNAGGIIRNSNSPKNAKLITSLIDKVTDIQKNSPELWNNQNFADNVRVILQNSSSPESASVALKILEKPELFESKNFADKIGIILRNSYSPESTSVALKILEKPELFENEDFADKVEFIIRDSYSPEIAQTKISLIDKVTDIQKNNPELWNKFADNVGNIIRNSNAQVSLVIDKIENIQKNNPELWNKFADNVGNIILNSNAQVSLVIDKIENIQKNNPELWNKFADNVGKIIRYFNSPNCVSVTLKILENPILFENKNFVNHVTAVINASSVPDGSRLRILMIDKIIDIQKNNPELWNNKNFADNVVNIIGRSYSTDSVKSMTSIIDKMADIQKNNPELWNNKNFTDNIGNIISCSISPEWASVALETFKRPELWNNKHFVDIAVDIMSTYPSGKSGSIALEILNRPDLFNNKNFMNNIKNILCNSYSPESASVALKMLEKSELFNNKNFVDKIEIILCNSHSPERASVALKMLEKPELFENEDFANSVKFIIYNTASPKIAQAKILLIDKITDIQKNNPELWNNKNFADNVGTIISSIDLPENAQVIISIIDKITDIQKNNPELWNNKNFADNVGRIIRNSNAQVSLVIDKIIDIQKNNPELWNNKNFADNVGSIISYTNEENIVLVGKLLADKKFPKELIPQIIICSDKQDTDAKIKMYDFCEDKKFTKEQIANIIINVNALNIDTKIKMYDFCEDKGFPKDSIADVILCTDQYNIDTKIKMYDFCEDKGFPKDSIADVILCTNQYNIDTKIKMYNTLSNVEDFPKEFISKIMIAIDDNGTNLDYALDLCQNYKKYEVPINKIPYLVQNAGTISQKQIQKLNHVMGRDRVAKLSDSDFVLACNFAYIYKKNNINEIPASGKKALLRELVASNTGLFKISDELSKDFPLIPKNQEEYCSLLPSIVRSLGIETTPLTPEQRIAMFNSSMKDLSLSVAKLSDVDFAKLQITQDLPKDEFIKIVLEKVKDLSSAEKQKVYDYFGFELHHNRDNAQTGYSITGYPVNLNNGKKLAQIEDVKTKAVVEDLRPDVIRFSKENPIRCNNPEVEAMLNQIVEALPELRTAIGRAQHGNNGTKGAHDFDVMKHSLKVMQKIVQDPQFAKLNETDQKLMLLASLMHDITKAEGKPDKTHANESSFDSFFIAKKFNLTKEEEIKLYTLIRHHEWLEYVNTAKSEEQLTKRLQSVAYDLQQDNLFDMALMFTHADLRAVKADNSFHDRVDGRSRVDFKGNVRSFGQSADLYAQRIREYAQELQKSKPILPVTKFPKADRISQAITHVNPDGSTNIKGVYKDKDGLVIIRFNEVEDWEAIGFAKGSVSKGYTSADGERETGNIKFFVHGLDYANQLSKFDAFSLVDSDALLSVSYAEAIETKYRFFRSQGVILDVDTKYIHGGGETDSGSGCGKDINEFKNNYAYKGSTRHSDRTFIADMVKKATGMTDSEYIEFVKANANKPMSEIEPTEIRDKIIEAFATINSRTRRGDRSYNEMYISNPSEVMGVFAYSQSDNIGSSATEFVERNDGRLGFLKQYALERNIPLVIFGD